MVRSMWMHRTFELPRIVAQWRRWLSNAHVAIAQAHHTAMFISVALNSHRV